MHACTHLQAGCRVEPHCRAACRRCPQRGFVRNLVRDTSALMASSLTWYGVHAGMRAVRGRDDAINVCAAGALSAALLSATCEYIYLHVYCYAIRFLQSFSGVARRRCMRNDAACLSSCMWATAMLGESQACSCRPAPPAPPQFSAWLSPQSQSSYAHRALRYGQQLAVQLDTQATSSSRQCALRCWSGSSRSSRVRQCVVDGNVSREHEAQLRLPKGHAHEPSCPPPRLAAQSIWARRQMRCLRCWTQHCSGACCRRTHARLQLSPRPREPQQWRVQHLTRLLETQPTGSSCWAGRPGLHLRRRVGGLKAARGLKAAAAHAQPPAPVEMPGSICSAPANDYCKCVKFSSA